MAEASGADALTGYEKKASCCGGALMFSEAEKLQALVKGIIEAAYDHGADYDYDALCNVSNECRCLPV